MVQAGTGMPVPPSGAPAMNCLDRLELSEAQRAALADPHPRILVGAGAGSGKTRLLVAYFVQALLDAGLPPERLAAVTFTRKAGAELVSRIRTTLEECGRPDLARSLDAATVGTIHGLCRRLLREHALRARVDPAFSVLEADAALLAKEEASRAAWAETVETADGAQLEVLATRGDALRREGLWLYDRLRGIGLSHPQVVVAPAPPSPELGDSALDYALPQTDTLAHLTACAQAALVAGRDKPKPSATLHKSLAGIAACVECFQHESEGREDELIQASRDYFPTRTAAMESVFEPFRRALTAHRRALAEVQLKTLVDTVNLFLRLFDSRYSAFKEERGLLDFADLELRARDLLLTAGRDLAETPAFAGAWVLVDEFQDTNELQCAVLEGLGADRLIMVGDERQSIYRFRGADVEVFRRRQRAMREGLHRLDVNYRSRSEVLAFVNRLFSHADFFGEGMRQLEAGREDGAAPAGASGEGTPPPSAVEVLVVDRAASPDPGAPTATIQESEAQVVGDRVRVLIDKEGRAQRDIVLLLPALTQVSLYEQALVERGVKVYVVRGKGYYSQDEIYDVSALLRVLVNPHDDLALVTVLRSPLAGISDDGLYVLGRARREARAASLWEVLRGSPLSLPGSEDKAALDGFMSRLGNLRSRVGRPGLSLLIDQAVSTYDYDLCVLSGPDSRRRFANLRKLMRMADDFETLAGPDLAGFVELISSLGDLGDDEGNAPSLAEGEDVVRIMSVHQAKGLEFPVVVVAGLGSDAPGDRTGEFVVAGDGRMGVFLKGSRRETYEEHDLAWGPAAEIVQEQKQRVREEDVRLLYVAMTRAEDKLVLVGARSTTGDGRGRRIGRIVTALGLEAPPDPGEALSVPGLDVLVRGMSPPTLETLGAADRAKVASTDLGAGPVAPASLAAPCFLEIPRPSLGLRQVSFSALAAYGQCPRRFYLERVLGLAGRFDSTAEDDPRPEYAEAVLDEAEAVSGRDVGLLVHALLEQADFTTAAPSPEELRPKAEAAMREMALEPSASAVERAVHLTAAFWRSPAYQGASRAPAETLLRETPFLFPQGDVLVSGVLDLAWDEEGKRCIADYKTNKLGGRSPAQAAEAYRLQAVVYCLAALRAGAHRVQMDLVFLERPEEPVVFAYGSTDMGELEARLEAALAGLRDGCFQEERGPGCGSCPVLDLCGSMAPA